MSSECVSARMRESLEVSAALWIERKAVRECGGGTLAGLLLWKCENLHFYLLIYLTDRALKQPSINKRHVGNE